MKLLIACVCSFLMLQVISTVTECKHGRGCSCQACTRVFYYNRDRI
jgi:hypothetical protein